MRFALALMLAGAISSCSPPPERGPVVLAASSLQGALDTVADHWTDQGRAPPVLSYAGSQVLARQVESGAPADIVFLADARWMDELGRGALIVPESRRDIAANRMVVVRREPPARSGLPAALAGERIAMGEPDTVPAGRYAKAALDHLGLWPALAARVVPTDSVRAALALAERGEVDAAVVYASDARLSGKVAVAAVIPANAHPPIRYPAALTRAADHTDASAFIAYLSSAEARRLFARGGFASLAD